MVTAASGDGDVVVELQGASAVDAVEFEDDIAEGSDLDEPWGALLDESGGDSGGLFGRVCLLSAFIAEVHPCEW